MVDIFLPTLSVGFWAREGTVWGYANAGMPATGTAVHQPFNPSEALPYPNDLHYSEQEIYFYNSINAPGKVFSVNLETMEVEFPTAVFVDPFLLLCAFNNKTVSGAANWGAGNTGTITANNSADTYKDSIMFQEHLDNPTESNKDIDRTFHGGEITKYKLSYETGKLLMEDKTIKFMSFVEATRAYSADANFDDGSFADWDQDAPFHATACSVEWGGVAPAGIEIEKASFEITLEKNQVHVASSRTASIHHDGIRKATCTIEGYLTKKDQLAQIESLHDDKTKNTLEFIYNDAGGTEERKLQFTIGYVSAFSCDGIPSGGNPVKCSITFSQGESSVLSYSGSWTGHTDPYASPNRINCVSR